MRPCLLTQTPARLVVGAVVGKSATLDSAPSIIATGLCDWVLSVGVRGEWRSHEPLTKHERPLHLDNEHGETLGSVFKISETRRMCSSF